MRRRQAGTGRAAPCSSSPAPAPPRPACARPRSAELLQPAFGALDCLKHAELHGASVGVLASSRALGRLMAAAGVPDFTMRDVYAPDGRRLQRLLSAVVNFAKHREDVLEDCWRPAHAPADAAAARLQQLREEHAEKARAGAQGRRGARPPTPRPRASKRSRAPTPPRSASPPRSATR